MVAGFYIPRASFKGKHNLSKSKAFITLYFESQGRNRPLVKNEIAKRSGCPYYSVRCDKWHRWHYLKRFIVQRPWGLAWGYKLTVRGIRFVEERIPDYLMSQYLEQIKTGQHQGVPENE